MNQPCISRSDTAHFVDCMCQCKLLFGCLLCTSITSSTPNPSELVEASTTPKSVCCLHALVNANKRLLCRILGLSKGWKKLYCALVPFSPAVGTEATELQLMFIDESALTLVDKVVVTDCRSEACATRARLHIDLVRNSVTWTKPTCCRCCMFCRCCLRVLQAAVCDGLLLELGIADCGRFCLFLASCVSAHSLSHWEPL